MSRMDEDNRLAREYLKAPYSRVLIPDAETSTYAAKITEFPGCVAQGDTPEEAYRNLEAAAESWIEELVGMGQRVPEPSVFNQYSGRIALRLPKSLHRNAAQLAEREGTSLNQFLVSAIAQSVGTSDLYQGMVQDLGTRLDELTAGTANRMIGFSENLMPWSRRLVSIESLSPLGNDATRRLPVVRVATTDPPERSAGTPNG